MKSQFLSFKKGNVFLDTITVSVMLVIFGLFVFLGYIILDGFNEDFQADADMSVEAKEKLQTLEDSYPKTMDYLFLTFLVLFWISAIISSFAIDTHPIFFVLSIILLIIVLIVGAELSNSYQELAEESFFQAEVFPIINWVLSNLVIMIVFIAISIIIALYAKSSSGGVI